MRADAAGRWISDDGLWIFEAATDRWLARTPPIPPPSEVVVPPPPPSEVAGAGAEPQSAPSMPPAREAAPPPLPTSEAGAAVPTEAGPLPDVGLLDAAPTGELPPVGPPGPPPSAHHAESPDGTRPGLVSGARPADRPAARPGAAQDQLAALLTPRRLAVLGVVLALLVVTVLACGGQPGGLPHHRPARLPRRLRGQHARAAAVLYLLARPAPALDALGGVPPGRPAGQQRRHSRPAALRRGGGRLHRPAPAGGSVSRGGSGAITPTGEGHRSCRGSFLPAQSLSRRGGSTTRAAG